MDEKGGHDENRSEPNGNIEQGLATAEIEKNDMATQTILEVKAARETETVADDMNDAQWGRLRVKRYATMMNGKRVWIIGIFEGGECRSNYDEVVEHQEKKPPGNDREK
jgi:hypothetical protein